MSLNPEHPTIFSNQLNKFDKFQRELSKLRYHIKMKRRIYDESEFNNINDRIKQCEAYFKKEKYQLMRKEADKILGDSQKMKNDVYREVKGKLELSRKMRVKPYLTTPKDPAERFNINTTTEQSSLSEEKVIMEYELTPATDKKYRKILNSSRIKTVGHQKSDNQRFVSDFQKKIKEELSKIPLNSYSRFKEIDQSNDEQEQRTSSISRRLRTPSFKLAPIGSQSQPRSLEKKRHRHRGNLSMVESIKPNRYEVLKEKIQHDRAIFKEREHKQIDKISRDEINWTEKSRLLKNLYSKYGSKSSYGDDDALDLMSKANLARANLILEKNHQQ